MMNSAILLSSLWLLAAPPGDTSLAPVPGDYELWRVDRHNQASGLDTLSKCVLSRFDLANPTKPEQIPVDAPTSFSLSAGAQWAGLSGLLANNSSKIDDYLPKKPLLANNFVRGVLSVSHDEKMVLTFGLENDKPMPNYIEYQIVETKTKKKIFNGRFRGHCMRGEASGLLTEGDTLAYFVKRSRSPSAKSHGHLIAISRQGNESRIPHIDAWQVFSSPTGSAVLIADFYFDDEGKSVIHCSPSTMPIVKQKNGTRPSAIPVGARTVL